MTAVAGWADRSDRERTIVTGADRIKVLNNLCTNDLKRLSVGQGCEAFITSLQGKTLGWVTIHDRGRDLLLRSDPGGLDLVLPHCKKYGIFDDVDFTDARPETFEIHVPLETGETLLASDFPPGMWPDEGDLRCKDASGAIGEVTLVRESPFGVPGLTLIGPVGRQVEFLGRMPAGSSWNRDDVEGLRIAAGTPRFGADITPDNLPQEIDRDARAISFVKGCYLGQETVARLDALGHVNKILRRIEAIEGDLPAAGTPLLVDGNSVGVVTSSGHAAGGGGSVAMAMVRVKPAPPGTIVSWDRGQGRIASLAP